LTQYYYLVASLPLLRPDDPPPFRSAAWLELCREHVLGNDHALLARISFDSLGILPGDHAVWQSYASWETALRNELAVQRAQRLGLSPDPFLRQAPFHAGLHVLAKEALAAGSPRAVEAALDRRRWSCLEGLEAGTQFDLGRLIVYRLKLLLLERKSRFQTGPGLEAFTAAYAQVLDHAAARANGAPITRHTENLHD